jgi:hypothetical protein
VDADTVYARLRELRPRWRWIAADCAAALRLYADKYHPAEKPKGAIFETAQSELV